MNFVRSHSSTSIKFNLRRTLRSFFGQEGPEGEMLEEDLGTFWMRFVRPAVLGTELAGLEENADGP